MRRVSEALTRQRELWSLHLLDRVATPPNTHPLLTSPMSILNTPRGPDRWHSWGERDIFQPSVVPGDC